MTISDTKNKYADCIKTRNGYFVNVFKPDPATIDIRDIAFALARMPRFGGHTNEFFSVARHSVAVHNMMLTDELRLCALLHDASEAYLIDIPSPIKQHLPEYKKIENELMQVIASEFGFSWPLPEIIKEADQIQLEIEWDTLMTVENMFPDITNFDTDERMFLEAFYALKL